jgi:hypothetical protein
LGEAESVLLELDAIPMFRSKLKLLHHMSSFDAFSLQSAAKTCIDACTQLCLSPALPKLLSLLLSHANFMNAGRGSIIKVRQNLVLYIILHCFDFNIRVSE